MRGTNGLSKSGPPPSGLATAPTIRDVAREAGVGIGTVSRVLGASPRVSPATRERVRLAMQRLGYRPSPVARALPRGRTQTLEVLVPLFTRSFYVEVLRGIEVALAETDYSLVIRVVERQADRDRAFAEYCAHGRFDGLIIVSLAPSRDLLWRLAAARQPAVLIDGESAGLSSVAVDHRAAAASATRYLLQLGHRRIALIDHPEDPLAPTHPGQRMAGYRLALAEAGHSPRPDYEIVTDFSPEAGMAALASLLAAPRPPTAVFVGSDTQAVGVLEAARQLGCRVPDDLSVVGYNDIELAQHLGLTTVRVPMREMGQQGAKLLLEALAAPTAPPAQLSLTPEVVARRTAAPPASP